MLPTNFLVKKRENLGFTLMEIIIVVAVLGVISVIISGILITSLTGSSKAEVIKDVRQNGSYALSVIEGMVINSRSVSCTTDQILTVMDLDGFSTNFFCNNGRIASDSATLNAYLTSTNVAVTGCSFTCSVNPGVPTKVEINFTVSQIGSSDLKSSEKSSQNFNSVVVARNFE